MTVEVNGINGPDEPPAGVPEHCASVADACHADCDTECDGETCGNCACDCEDCEDARAMERALDALDDEPLGVAEAQEEGWWRA